jgi:hypothetical protein
LASTLPGLWIVGSGRPPIVVSSSGHRGRGKRITGDALAPVSDATTVRVSRGKVLVTDGPFTESKEWIVGFDILECDDLDEAIAIAARHPQANGGKLELRPFRTDDD